MAESSLNVLAVIGSLQRDSVTRWVVRHVAQQLQAAGCAMDVLELPVRADLAGTGPGFWARHRE
jgi:NAD(P)H-dependent FMN reductase